jgi:tellurite resistance protein TerC
VIRRIAQFTYKAARRVVVGVVGATILVIGVVMIFTPGPALVLIPLGLAVLSIEFAWARYWLRRVRERISRHNSDARSDAVDAQIERVSGKAGANEEKKTAPEN